jgi:hypothetical protein
VTCFGSLPRRRAAGAVDAAGGLSLAGVGDALWPELSALLSLGGTGIVMGADQSRPAVEGAAGSERRSENGLVPGLDLTVVGAVELDE